MQFHLNDCHTHDPAILARRDPFVSRILPVHGTDAPGVFFGAFIRPVR